MPEQTAHHIERDVKDESLELSGTVPVVVEGSVTDSTIVTEGDRGDNTGIFHLSDDTGNPVYGAICGWF